MFNNQQSSGYSSDDGYEYSDDEQHSEDEQYSDDQDNGNSGVNTITLWSPGVQQSAISEAQKIFNLVMAGNGNVQPVAPQFINKNQQTVVNQPINQSFNNQPLNIQHMNQFGNNMPTNQSTIINNYPLNIPQQYSTGMNSSFNNTQSNPMDTFRRASFDSNRRSLLINRSVDLSRGRVSPSYYIDSLKPREIKTRATPGPKSGAKKQTTVYTIVPGTETAIQRAINKDMMSEDDAKMRLAAQLIRTQAASTSNVDSLVHQIIQHAYYGRTYADKTMDKLNKAAIKANIIQG